MSVYRTDDPIADFNRRDREQAAWEDSLPKCAICHEPLDDYIWAINGQILCEFHAEKKYRQNVEDYMR